MYCWISLFLFSTIVTHRRESVPNSLPSPIIPLSIPKEPQTSRSFSTHHGLSTLPESCEPPFQLIRVSFGHYGKVEELPAPDLDRERVSLVVHPVVNVKEIKYVTLG